MAAIDRDRYGPSQRPLYAPPFALPRYPLILAFPGWDATTWSKLIVLSHFIHSRLSDFSGSPETPIIPVRLPYFPTEPEGLFEQYICPTADFNSVGFTPDGVPFFYYRIVMFADARTFRTGEVLMVDYHWNGEVGRRLRVPIYMIREYVEVCILRGSCISGHPHTECWEDIIEQDAVLKEGVTESR
jgi:hypothetical protein